LKILFKSVVNQDIVFIYTVVVDKAKRGYGYGRKLMELSEIYAQK